MSAIPIIPILPANEVSTVLAFFVIRLLSESESAVFKVSGFFLIFGCFFFGTGFISSAICPSSSSV